MAATTYGTFGLYGVEDEALKGLYASSVTGSYSVDNATATNHEGEVIAASFFNESAELSVSGVTVTVATTTQVLAAAIDIANTAIFGTDSGVTNFYVNSINIGRTDSEFETGDCTAMGWIGV